MFEKNIIIYLFNKLDKYYINSYKTIIKLNKKNN